MQRIILAVLSAALLSALCFAAPTTLQNKIAKQTAPAGKTFNGYSSGIFSYKNMSGGGGGGSSSWGGITGTLSSQTDLQSALNTKAPILPISYVQGSTGFTSLVNKTFRIYSGATCSTTLPAGAVNGDRVRYIAGGLSAGSGTNTCTITGTAKVNNVSVSSTVMAKYPESLADFVYDGSGWVGINIDSTQMVPYTGATSDINVGAHNVTAAGFIGSGAALTDIFTLAAKDHGVKCDGKSYMDGAMTSGSNVLSTSASITSADIGKWIIVTGAATNELNLETTITGVSPVTLAASAATTVSGAEFFYSTDNKVALQSIVDTYTTQDDMTGRIWRNHPETHIVFPSNKQCGISGTINIVQKDDITFEGGAELVWGDYDLFNINTSKRVTFRGLKGDGFQFNKAKASPTQSNFLYIQSSDPTVLETRARTIKIEDCRIFRTKKIVDSPATWSGVELLVMNSRFKAFHVLGSVGFNIWTTDNQFLNNIINGFQKNVVFRAGVNFFTGNHYFTGFGPVDTPLNGVSTSSGSPTISISSATNINVGNYYTLSAGFPSTSNPYKVISKTSNTATFDTNSNSTQSGVILSQYVTSDYMWEINTTSKIYGVNEDFDNAAKAMVRIIDGSNISIIGGHTQRDFNTPYAISFEPAASNTGLTNILIRDHTFVDTTSSATAAINYSANVNLANNVNTFIGPNNYTGGWANQDTHTLPTPAQVSAWTGKQSALTSKTCSGTDKMSAVDASTGLFTCTADVSGGGSMAWPGGGAGIPNYNGSSAWGTSYSSGNTIPSNFIPTLNQNTSGTAGGLAAQYIDWNASSGGASITNKPILPTFPSGAIVGTTDTQTLSAKTLTAPIVAVLKPASDSTTAVQITKADGTTPILSFDTTNSWIGRGITPADPLHINTSDGATPTLAALHIEGDKNREKVALDSYGTGNTPSVVYRFTLGSKASPTPVLANKTLGQFVWQGYDGVTPGTFSPSATFLCGSGSDWTSGNHDTFCAIKNAGSGETAQTERIRIGKGIMVGTTTDPGAGNLSVAGTIASAVATGTAPFTVASTTKVTNLNVEQLDGADLDTDGTLAANSDVKIASQKAIVTYAIKKGTLTNGKTCTTDGTVVNCTTTSSAFDPASPGDLGGTTPFAAKTTTLAVNNGTTAPATNNVIEAKDGHISSTQTTLPTTSSCGTSSTVVGTDNDGRIAITGTTVSTCTLTFNKAFNTIYGCVLTTNIIGFPTTVSSISTSAVVFAPTTFTGSLTIYYHCAGK